MHLTASELEMFYCQSWAIRKIIDIPVDDAFREWRIFNDSYDGRLMQEADKKHYLKRKLDRLARVRRLFGTGLIGIFTSEAPLDEPLELDRLRQGDFKNLVVFMPQQVDDEYEITSDHFSPNFGKRDYYKFNIKNETVKLHHTRVIQSDENSLPSSDGFSWGNSVLTPTEFPHLIANLMINHRKDLKDAADTLFFEVVRNDSGKITDVVSLIDNFERDVTNMLPMFNIPAERFWGVSPLGGLNSVTKTIFQNYAILTEVYRRQILENPLRRIDEIMARDAGLTEVPRYTFDALFMLNEKNED